MAPTVSFSGSLHRIASPAGALKAAAAASTSRRHASIGVLCALRQPGRTYHVVLAAKEGGVIDKPATTPKNEQKNSASKKMPPIYNVMLHNDNFNRREYVVKVLLKVVECINVDDAINIMQEAHNTGVALVTSCAQDTAEQYCESLRLNGLVASLEPGR